MKIAIIGGGASGMMAALTASECAENRVLLLERQARVAKKLLATGNGRCNLTNMNGQLHHYHGSCPEFCRYALEAFDPKAVRAYFHSLGLVTVSEDTGRVYPYSDSANSVADVLRLHLEQRENVQILTSGEVQSLRRKNKRFYLQTQEQCHEADRVIVCCGGVAGGKLGGTDLGYKLLASFGHSRTKLYPALVQLKTDNTFTRSLKGVRCEALVRCGSQSCQGELQFTDYGVSGPVIFSLSRALCDGKEGHLLQIDLMPELSCQALEELLRQRCSSLPQLTAENLFTGILHNRLGRTMVRACGLSLEQPCGSLSDAAREQLARTVKEFRLSVTGNMGMDNAQVTAGGICTGEFDPETMESRLCPGLYAAGEVLDIDGDCGGYNLQWAWSSGRLAGQLKGKL